MNFRKIFEEGEPAASGTTSGDISGVEVRLGGDPKEAKKKRKKKYEDIDEDFATDLNMEIYKFLKRKTGKKFFHQTDDFKADEFMDFKYKDSKFKLHLNYKDYNKPVYNFEWM